jgi:transaldolase/glucose-6-phosphate isomerase
MKENPLLRVQSFGQSIWLDYIRRHMITSGELKQLIEEDGLRGVTSNPKIFGCAISGSQDYDSVIRSLALEGKSGQEIYETLIVEDIQQAADLFRPVYDRSDGRNGFVSLEVDPHVAHDTQRTISEARRLWSSLNRPNVLIGVAATPEGLPAIQQLISEGININVTLLFGLPRYRMVVEAYIAGLERRVGQGEEVDRVASVASFFLSRIDVLMDNRLARLIEKGGTRSERASHLRGKVAIATAKMAYQICREIFGSQRFRDLSKRGAMNQRLLWTSTNTKNPDDSDVKYVEALIGPETINAIPQETLNAYRDHGVPVPRLEEDLEEARMALRQLSELGINIDQVTQQLEDEGIEKFNKPYDSLMETVKRKQAAALGEPVDRQTMNMGRYRTEVQRALGRLELDNFITRLWRKDPTLWKKDPQNLKAIRESLGWLHVAEKMEEQSEILQEFISEVKTAGFLHVVHMGMGGSSLAPLAFRQILAPKKQGVPLTVLDTTDPETILRIERKVPLSETLFIVASKSGTTAEPNAFLEYFYSKVKTLKGDRAGKNFVAITDPGSPLAGLARDRSFLRTFLNFVDIGGRYSALSYFGLVPAALMGIDVSELLIRALRMVHASNTSVPTGENPGLILGAGMAELAKHGRDKVTFVMSESISTFGMWLEQLLAESTGKEGTGLLPVSDEPLGPPSVYGKDRLFVHFLLNDKVEEAVKETIGQLAKEGHPVVTIRMEDPLDIGQEFFRWEIATATAGSILGINAFDQPNVQESKDHTNRLLEEVRRTGKLAEPSPLLSEGSLQFYGMRGANSAKEYVKNFLGQARQGDYVALQAYLPETPTAHQALQALRLRLRDGLRLATTLGYGPRFLHSTGQYHKGGPNTGLFLQLTADQKEDISVPEQPYTFGIFKHAQALGDMEALQKHGRRVVRIHLRENLDQGLKRLAQIVQSALEAT